MESLIEQALASNDPAVLRLAHEYVSLIRQPYHSFRPRPDNPEQLDQQTSFYQDTSSHIICALGGNGSGKSFTGARRVARFVRETPPPEVNTPFWIVSQNMEMATAVCWQQNLSQFITPDYIQDIVWYSATKGLPRTVVLKPHKNGNNFILEFKSYDQGRQALQGSNIAGFWCDEQCPFELLTELLARTRKWASPFRQYTLTPLEPDLKLEEIFTEPHNFPDWRFYRLNTRFNTAINPDFVRQIEQNEIEGLIETRLTGAFARYEGAIYPTFDTKTHVIEPFEIPRTWLHVRGLDLGFSHATACVWAVRDLEGRYYVYREYLKAKSSIEDHVREINEGWEQLLVRGHTYADPAAAQTLYEFTLRGLATVPANKDVKAGIATVQSLLRPAADGQPKLFVFKTCENLIREMRTYVWDAKKLDQPRKINDDLVDALRYLCHSHSLDSNVSFTPLKQPEKKRVPF